MRCLSLACLGLLLCASGALGAATGDIFDKYGFCPKYVVKEGDTLFDLANKFNVSLDDLTATVAACDQAEGTTGVYLQVNSTICLPGYDIALCSDVMRTDPDRPWCQVYLVQSGDTLVTIAGKLNITEEELVSLNSDYLAGGTKQPHAGQYLRVPGWNQVQCRDFNDNDRPNCQMYEVKAGDTAILIAQKYKVDVTEMLTLNGLTNTSTLPVGTKLKLPKWNDTCPAEGIPAVLPSDTVVCRVVTLGQGWTIAYLANKYMTTIKAIMSVNPSLAATNATVLQPGMYINLPPFGPDCIGKGELVDVPAGGNTSLPPSYDYNGLSAAAPPTAAPAPPSTGAPEAAPSPTIAPSPAVGPTESPSLPPTAAPSPVPVPPSSASATGASLLGAALALLAGALML